MINTSESGDSVSHKNSWWIFTSVFHLALSPQEHCLTVQWCPMPSCFIDGSLCVHLPQYQHLASENSLGSISIIQPSCTKGTGREGRINLEAWRRRWNDQPVLAEGWPAISIFCHRLNKVVGNNCTSTLGDADTYLCPAIKSWNWAHDVRGVGWWCSTHAQHFSC